MKKTLVSIVLGLWTVLGTCDTQNNQRQTQKECDESKGMYKHETGCYYNCIIEPHGTRVCEDTQGRKRYFLPENDPLMVNIKKLKQSRDELEQLIKKYGERKIINREEVVYWEFGLKEINKDFSPIPYTYILYNNGDIQSPTHLLIKDPLDIKCPDKSGWGRCGQWDLPLFTFESVSLYAAKLYDQTKSKK